MTKQPSTFGRLLMRGAPIINAPIAALAKSPRFGGLVNRNIAVLSYTGRKSGRHLSLPVAYRRTADGIVVNANLPQTKTWWRNFLGEGAPLTVQLDGTERAGHGVATVDGKGRVAITVRLTD